MMRYLVFYAVDMATWSATLVPALALVGRLRGRRYTLAQELWILVLAVYLAGVYNVAGAPELPYIAPDPNLNLIPLVDAATDPAAYIRNTVLNIIMFMPLGFLLPLLWRAFRSTGRICLTGFCLSLAIELAQLLNYRITDVDDLIFNTLGTLLGYLILKGLCRRRSLLLEGTGYGLRQFLVVLGVVVLIMFVLRPYITLWIYQGMFG